jgi:antitoxin (DNA-binding transcriptional repressor) of toxin-antitoxin stability system
MHRLSRIIVNRQLSAVLCAVAVPALLAQTSTPKNPAARSVSPITVRTVKVLGSKDAVEIEVEASDPVVPQTKVLTGPDRLVVDFPKAAPSNQLRSQAVNQGEVKGLRVGLLKSKPPVTRVVLDLRTAQSYQIFPYGRTVIIKVMGSGAEASARMSSSVPTPAATRPALVAANYTSRAEPGKVDTSDQPSLDVTYRDGLLGIRADKATLAEVLYAVQQHTGAEIRIAAGAEQEKIVADIAPAPAPEVLARLLNGSTFNFLILSAANDPLRLERVILSPRPEAGLVASPTPAPVQDGVQDEVQGRVKDNNTEETEPASADPQPGGRAPTPSPQVPGQTDAKTPANENTPDQ